MEELLLVVVAYPPWPCPFRAAKAASILRLVGHAIYTIYFTLPVERRFALGAILVYQLTLWYRYEHEMDLRVGLKPFLKAAGAIMTTPQLNTIPLPSP